MRPTSLVMSTVTVVIGGMIVFNAFFGQSSNLAPRFASKAPVGASTRVVFEATDKSSRTLTLKYDEMVEDVQRELLATGHFQGLVDGVDGPKTQIAIEAYQTENNLDVTGEASKHLLEQIRFLKKVAQASEFTGSIGQAEVEQLSETKTVLEEPVLVKPKKIFVVEEPKVPTPTAKPKLVSKPVLAPVGKPAKLPPVVKAAKLQIEKPKTEKPKPAKLQPRAESAVLNLQQRLAKLGYDPHSRSGELDEATKSAILTFQMDKGLDMEGSVSKSLLLAMQKAEQQKLPQ